MDQKKDRNGNVQRVATRGLSSTTPVPTEPASLETIMKELRDMKRQLSSVLALREDIRIIKKELSDLDTYELLPHCETGLPWRRHEVWSLCVSGVRSGLVRVRAPPAAGVLADGAYQPPHVRRRHLIQEIQQQYKKDLTEPELLESLFRAP
ncbi:unnamed protein product [Leptidea sinapis]|uniref:Uncharacterized protein n=1 Tax=Leptidea sinapis TaxID=189913 RepID=A0A5E4Q1B3_9NEOP|nr:unnamed protein product [Leptidea sinapis]